MFVEPNGFPAAEHIHPSQTEHFLVKEGELRLRKQDEEEVYQAGAEYSHVIYPSSPLRPLQQILFAVLAPIGKLFGYRADYPYPERELGD